MSAAGDGNVPRQAGRSAASRRYRRGGRTLVRLPVVTSSALASNSTPHDAVVGQRAAGSPSGRLCLLRTARRKLRYKIRDAIP